MPSFPSPEPSARQLPPPTLSFQRLRCLVINRVEWPESEYLVDRRRRFLYCPIAKVACSSLKRWFLAVNGERLPDGCDEHVAAQRHRLRELPAARALQILDDRGYFRFAFVRNPWSRLVSAYLNKFLGQTSCAERVARQLRGRSWRPDAQGAPSDVTFAEFVRYLARRRPGSFDVHWRPQHDFLKDHAFDFIGRFEHLQDDFALLQERLGTDVPLQRCNATCYQKPHAGAPLVADDLPEQLLAMGKLPGYTQFYTTELREIVARIYDRDIELFGYAFEEGASAPEIAKPAMSWQRRMAA